MDTRDAIQARRSVKHYDPQHRMTDEETRQLLSLAMLAPTAFNIQNWRFLLVRDVELRRQIRAVAWDQAQVTDASLLVILCADLTAWEKEPRRYWRDAPGQVQRDEAMRSCGIAAQTLMLAAKSMGYDSCPMDGFDFDAVGKLVRLPPDHVIAMFVAIGKGIKDAWPRPGQLPMNEVVITDRFA
jgi:nitroreductase